MTAAADITVKKYDGTTDITWSVLKGAGGDSDPAVWRSNSASGYVGQRPTFQVSSRGNQAGTVRRLDFRGEFPSVYTNADTSQTQVAGTVVLTGSIAVPGAISSTDVNEACAQLMHLLANSAVVNAMIAGYAPT